MTIFGWQGVSSLLSMGLSVWQAIVCNFVAKLIQIAVVLSLGWYILSLISLVNVSTLTETGSVLSGTSASQSMRVNRLGSGDLTSP